MPVTCQYCGTEAPDNRVMCPSCGRRLRPSGEAPAPATPAPTRVAPAPSTDAAAGYWTTPTLPPWAPPVAAEPPRPQLLYAREVTQRANRLTVAFRIILAVPQIIVAWALTVALELVGIIAWFAALFTGRLPDGIHEFMAGVVGYHTRVAAYVGLLTDRYPPFSFTGDDYPVRYATTKERLNRAAVFFRIILVVPVAFLATFVATGYCFIALITWFVVLILGRMPDALFDTGAGAQRFYQRMVSYLWMLTPAYPAGLFNDAGAGYGTPGYAAEADPATPQPPRQPSAAKRLLVVCIVIGAAGFGVQLAFGVAGGVQQAVALNDLRDAHNTVVRVFRSAPDCNAQQDPLACYRTTGQTEAAAFRSFTATVSGLHFHGAAATADRTQLLDTTQALIQAYDRVAQVGSPQEAQTLLPGLLPLLDAWDKQYAALDNDILSQR